MSKKIQKLFTLFFALFLPVCMLPDFPREEFENGWWQTDEYGLCFNFHQRAEDTAVECELLVYDEEHISYIGEWAFIEPNEYRVEDNYFTVEENNECWNVSLYYGIYSAGDTVCECTMKEDIK